MIKKTTDKELKIIVQTKYDQIVKDHGELFERVSLPMNDADKAEIKKKQCLIAFVLTPSLLVILSSSLYFVWDGSFLSYSFLVFLGLIIVLSAVTYFNYEHTLKSNSKEIIKGVLTNKQKIDDEYSVDYDFEISNKETIGVSRSDFRKFTIGDILEIESLSSQNSLNLKTKVKRAGSIFDNKI